MYYLILYMLGQGSSVIIVPEKYTKEQCEKVGLEWGNHYYKCIPAPENYCIQNIPGTPYTVTKPCEPLTGSIK